MKSLDSAEKRAKIDSLEENTWRAAKSGRELGLPAGDFSNLKAKPYP